MMEFENAFQKADAYAIAPYIGDTLDSTANANLSVQQVLDKMTQHLRDTTLNGVTGRIVENRSITQAKGLRFITYEGGQHLTANSAGGGSTLEALFASVNRSAGIKALYQEYLNTW